MSAKLETSLVDWTARLEGSEPVSQIAAEMQELHTVFKELIEEQRSVVQEAKADAVDSIWKLFHRRFVATAMEELSLTVLAPHIDADVLLDSDTKESTTMWVTLAVRTLQTSLRFR